MRATLSILENAAGAGVAVPTILTRTLAQLKAQTEAPPPSPMAPAAAPPDPSEAPRA